MIGSRYFADCLHFSKDKAEEITKEIRNIMKERKQIQDILQKYG